jgi:hypothetical protein
MSDNSIIRTCGQLGRAKGNCRTAWRPSVYDLRAAGLWDPQMLQLCSEQVRALLNKATESHERALHTTFPEDRQFWLDMEAKWLSLAGNAEYVERTSNLLAEIAKRSHAVSTPSLAPRGAKR